MAKVEITAFKANTARKIGESGTSVTKKAVRDQDGKRRTIRVIDLDSDTLSADLTYVFGRNVAKARQQNKVVTEAAEQAAAKG